MKQTLLSLSAALCSIYSLHAASISYNEGATLSVVLDPADDWWILGPDQLTETFSGPLSGPAHPFP